MLCFHEIGGFPCVDRPPKKRFDATTGREYAISDEDDSDGDSDDDAVNQFQRHKSIRMSTLSAKPRRTSNIEEVEENDVKTTEKGENDDETDDAVIAISDAVDNLKPIRQRAIDIGNDDFNENSPMLPEKSVVNDEESGERPTIDCGFYYHVSRSELAINIKQVRHCPNKDWQYQIHIAILPAKKYQFRTDFKNGENPMFLKLFVCRMPTESVSDTYVRLRLYGRSMALAPAKLLGASIISLATLPHDSDIAKATQLQPSEEGLWAVDVVENTPDIAMDTVVNSSPTVDIGLAYSALTGRLAVEIDSAKALHKLLNIKRPTSKLETYIKVLIMLGPTADRLLAQTKTRLSKGAFPTFKEKFVFQVAQFQLQDVTVGFMFYTRKKANFGWVAIGSISEPETPEAKHWADLRTAAVSHSSEVIVKQHEIRPPEDIGTDRPGKSFKK